MFVPTSPCQPAKLMPPANARVCSTTKRTTRASLAPGAAAARSNPITTSTADFLAMVILRFCRVPLLTSRSVVDDAYVSFRRWPSGCGRRRGLQAVFVDHDTLLAPHAILKRLPEPVLILRAEARLDHRRRGLERLEARRVVRAHAEEQDPFWDADRLADRPRFEREDRSLHLRLSHAS